MQIRCTNCHRPFALSREAVYGALELVVAENLKHYDAYCPHCRRANRISKQELLRAAPDWKPSPTATEQEAEEATEEVSEEATTD
jgi:hypothetical protein